jgi:outer membrane protein assembly factor BamB
LPRTAERSKRRRIVFTALLASGALFLSPGVARAGYDESVAEGINAGHTAFASGGSLDRPPLSERWRASLGTNAGYPVIAGGRVFVVAFGGATWTLSALAAVTGERLWWRAMAQHADLAYEDGTVYSLDDDGYAQAFNAATGAVRWTRGLLEPAGGQSSLVVKDGIFYTALSWSGGSLFALDTATGETLWTAPVSWNTLPAVDGRYVYASNSYYCATMALDRRTGRQAWNKAEDCYGGADHTLSDGGHVIDGHGNVMDSATGRLLDAFLSGPHAVAGNVAIVRQGSVLSARDLTTGVGKWEFSGDGALSSAPVVVNHTVYVGSAAGNVFALDLETGEEVWSDSVGPAGCIEYYSYGCANAGAGTAGFAAGGGLLVVPIGGELVALESATLAPTPGLDLKISFGPDGATSRTDAEFDFGASGTGFGYSCRLDGDAWAACASGVDYDGLSEGPHTFEVKTTSLAGEDVALAVRGWSVSSIPLESKITSGPPALVNYRYATFHVSVTPTDAEPECRLDRGPWGACPSGYYSDEITYSDLPDGAHVFETRATAPDGTVEDPPATWRWTVDTRAPTTTISAGPGDVAGSARFSFAADETGVTFKCQLDGGGWAACTSPKSYDGLGNGSHTFEVVGRDAAGNGGASASRAFTSNQSGPNTSITDGPDSLTRSTTASFSFTGSAESTRFECRLDGGAWGDCGSPRSYEALADGGHAFAVRAVDAAGTVDPTPPARSWTIDSAAPETTIDEPASGPAGAGGARFVFSSSEPGSRFRCALDYDPWAACASPISYAGLSPGKHVFRVDATDPAGNRDGSPDELTFTVSGEAEPGGGSLAPPADGAEGGRTATPTPPAGAPPVAAPRAPRAAAQPPASAAALTGALVSLLAAGDARELSRQTELRGRYRARSAGVLVVELSAGTGAKRVTVGRGTRTFKAAGSGAVRVRISRSGRKLLRSGRSVSLQVRTRFRTAKGRVTVSTRRVTLAGSRR